jgi:hypothetical protein
MPGLLRFAIIAYKPSQIALKTDEAVRIVFLDPNSNVNVWRDVSAGVHTLDITTGVYGFTSATEATVKGTTGQITVKRASGTDPWPDPPPAVPQGYNVATFLATFNNFLRSSGAGTVTTQLMPAEASP